MACANDASPLLLPWMNVTVTGDGKTVSRGIKMTIGTPGQNISLVPTVNTNGTLWLISSSYCISPSNDTCIGSLGGVYDPSQSSTIWYPGPNQWNGTVDDPEILHFDSPYILFNDVISFGSTQSPWSAYGFPLLGEEGSK
jgi:hypothetical protein